MINQWRRAKFDPLQNGDPWTDCHKIWHSWLRLGDDPYAKLRANPSPGDISANAWNITEIFLIYTFFSETHLQVRPFDGFSRAMAQMTRSQARMCLLGVTKSLKNPEKGENLAKKRDKLFDQIAPVWWNFHKLNAVNRHRSPIKVA